MISALIASAVLTATQAKRIDDIVTSVMRQASVPGLSLGVARKGSTLYLRGYGVRDASRGLRADGFTIYAAGSIAKQFTAALVLQDVAHGRLSLDEGVPPIGALLGHITGDRWEYRNENYARLGTLLERADGMSYCVLAAQRIYVPLHLISTSCDAPKPANNVAMSRAQEPQSIAAAAGGLWSNAPDLLRWLDALRDGRVVTPALFAAMTASGRLPSGAPTNYGYGFFVTDWYGYRVAFHDGFVDGYSCEDVLSLGDGIELAILTNADRVDLTPLAKSIFAIVDRPRETNSYATPSAPPQNENTQITAALRSILETPGFAAYGKLQLLEFTQRTVKGGTSFDRYRATFERAVLWVTVGYGARGVIESIDVAP